jgi:aminomethyltransferase
LKNWKGDLKVTRQTPFYNVGLQAGAEMRELFGYWLPWQYAAGPIAEHIATREKATVCDLDYMAEFRIQGPRAADFVANLLTNDFTNLAIGQGRYSAMCRQDGTMVDDGTLWRFDVNEYVLITGQESDGEWITSQANSGVEIVNLTDSWTTLAVQGPGAQKLVESLLPRDPIGALRYYRFLRTQVLGENCTLARMGYTGERGYEFHVPQHAAEDLWKALLEAGAADGVLPLGQAGLESLRQEAGYLLVGNDHDNGTNPLEAGIGRVVKFSKSDFNGREALEKIKRQGVERTLVWLALDDVTSAVTGDPILIDGNVVGAVTSGSYSPTLRRGVAMGYVTPKHAIPGIPLEVATTVGMRSAVLSTLPLYDPGNLRTRSNTASQTFV